MAECEFQDKDEATEEVVVPDATEPTIGENGPDQEPAEVPEGFEPDEERPGFFRRILDRAEGSAVGSEDDGTEQHDGDVPNEGSSNG